MLDRVFTKEFFFSSRLAFSRADKLLIVVFVAMLMVAVIFRWLAYLQKSQPVKARFFRRLSGGLLTFSLIGGLWVAFRFLFIPIFGTRMSAAVILAIFLVWLFFLFKYLFFKFAGEQRNWSQQQLKNKYLK